MQCYYEKLIRGFIQAGTITLLMAEVIEYSESFSESYKIIRIIKKNFAVFLRICEVECGQIAKT